MTLHKVKPFTQYSLSSDYRYVSMPYSYCIRSSVILLTFPIHFHIIEVYFYTNTVKPNMSNKCINLVTSVIFFFCHVCLLFSITAFL